MIIIPIAVTALGLLLTTVCKIRIVPNCTIFTVLILAVVVPSHSPPRDVLVAALGGAIFILCLATMRMFRRMGSSVPNMWLVVFLLYSGFISATEAEGPYAWFVVLATSLYVVLAIFAAMPRSNGTQVLYVAVPIIVILQVGLASAEEFGGVKAPWPLTNGSDNIAHRINPVAPWLVGRAMGSTSHPIPLGILMGACLVLAIWMARRRRHWYLWLIVALSGIGLIYAGTRSAFLATFVALAYWAITTASAKRAPFFLLTGILGVAAFLITDADALLGLGKFYSSESYLHRADVLAFIPELGERSITEVFFGSGYDSIASILLSSNFSGGTGILVFDQEYIRTFVSTGLIGLLLLLMSIIEGFRRGNIPSRMVLIFLCFIFASFDALSWHLPTTLFVLAASSGLMSEERVEAPELSVSLR